MIKIRIKNSTNKNFTPIKVKPVRVDLYKEVIRLERIRNKAYERK